MGTSGVDGRVDREVLGKGLEGGISLGSERRWLRTCLGSGSQDNGGNCRKQRRGEDTRSSKLSRLRDSLSGLLSSTKADIRALGSRSRVLLLSQVALGMQWESELM